MGGFFPFPLFVFLIFFYFNLPVWQQNWLLTRLRLIGTIEELSLEQPQIVFSAPSHWRYINSYTPPAKYIKNRNLGRSQNYNQSFAYTDAILKISSSESVAISRGQFLEKSLLETKKYDQNFKKKLVSSIVGYQPHISPRASKISITDDILWLNGRYDAPFRSIYLKNEKPKGVFIAIHGREGSPEGVVGRISDYSNGFGRYWFNQGYDVIAPDVQPGEGLVYPRLGLSSDGVDVALIMDLISYVRIQYGSAVPIVVGGISYGAKLSEIIGVLSDDVEGVISIGGAARYDYILSNFSLPHPVGSESYLNSELNRGGIFDLILPKKLVISLGTVDAGGWGEVGENKVYLLEKFSLRNKSSKNFRINLFYGSHESDPFTEFKLYNEM